MHKVILFISFLTQSMLTFSSDTLLVSNELIASYTKPQLEEIYAQNNIPTFFVPVNFEIDIYKLTYKTVDIDGQETIASGALVVPDVDTCFSQLQYHHGTTTLTDNVPSRESDELVIGIVFGSSSGFVTSLPDYLGLGDEPGLHPYVHAESEASCSIDMLKATRQFCKENNIALNEQLFLTGYSQGGHAALAVHRELQNDPSHNFEVTASAPMSGPFDLSGIMFDIMVQNENYPQPSFVPYVILSYEEVYGDIYDDLSEVFVSPFDTLIPVWFDGSKSTSFISSQLPDVPKEAMQPAFFQALTTNDSHPLRIALQKNDLYNWKPESPVNFFYCGGDETVPPENSTMAANNFQSLGATSIFTTEVSSTLDHSGCVSQAIIFAKFWFDDMKEGCVATEINDPLSQNELEIYPNPVTDDLIIKSIRRNVKSTDQVVEIYNQLGAMITSFNLKDNHRISFSSFNEGLYYLKIQGTSHVYSVLKK